MHLFFIKKSKVFVRDWKKLLFHLVLAQLATIPRQAAPCTMFKPPFNVIIISIIISIIIIIVIIMIISTQPKPKKSEKENYQSTFPWPASHNANKPLLRSVSRFGSVQPLLASPGRDPKVRFVHAGTAGGSVNFSIFTHFFVFLSLKRLKLGESDGVKFLA